MHRHRQPFLITHGFTCLAGLFLLLALKLYYSKADSDGLLWILAPTAWWVRTLSGIGFEYVPHTGYVSHSCRFVIAASCSGIQFWMVSASLLLFSFLPGIPERRKGIGWLGISFFASYWYTILVNGLRIFLSLVLPLYLQKTGSWNCLTKRISPEQLHTILGIVVYFGSLLVLFFMAESLFPQPGHDLSPRYHLPLTEEPSLSAVPVPPGAAVTGRRFSSLRWLLPAFWYFAIVLGLPFLNGAYRHEPLAFLKYSLTILFLSFPMLALSRLTAMLLRKKNIPEAGSEKDPPAPAS